MATSSAQKRTTMVRENLIVSTRLTQSGGFTRPGRSVGSYRFFFGSHSFHERSAGARLWAPRPACTSVLTQDATQHQNQRKNDSLNRYWGRHHCLRVAVPPQYVGYVEDRRPAGCTRIKNGK